MKRYPVNNQYILEINDPELNEWVNNHVSRINIMREIELLENKARINEAFERNIDSMSGTSCADSSVDRDYEAWCNFRKIPETDYSAREIVGTIKYRFHCMMQPKVNAFIQRMVDECFVQEFERFRRDWDGQQHAVSVIAKYETDPRLLEFAHVIYRKAVTIQKTKKKGKAQR